MNLLDHTSVISAERRSNVLTSFVGTPDLAMGIASSREYQRKGRAIRARGARERVIALGPVATVGRNLCLARTRVEAVPPASLYPKTVKYHFRRTMRNTQKPTSHMMLSLTMLRSLMIPLILATGLILLMRI